MNDTSLIDDVIVDNDVVVKKRKIPFIFIIVLIIGIAVMLIPGLGFGLDLCAFLAALTGLIGLLIPQKKCVYVPTGERLKKYEYWLDPNDKAQACANMEKGEVDKVIVRAKDSNSSLKLIVYTTKTKSCTMAQIQSFVPYQFVAVTNIVKLS